MSRRDLFLLFAFALLFNFCIAFFIREPGYLDDAYYFGGALRLARGYGFTEPYLWTYLGGPQSLPQPSHLYWMPLTSIVAALPMILFGQSFTGARAPFVFLASLLPLLAYCLAFRFTAVRRHAVCAGLLAIFSAYYPANWGTTDSFALYGVIGGLALWAIAKADSSADWRFELAAGMGAGLAHLTRADGVLLLVVALAAIARTWRFFTTYPSLVARHTAIVVGGYLAIMFPWFVRNMIAIGSPLGNGGAGTVWLIEYNDLFNYPANLTAQRYFAAGWQIILAGKWEALTINLQHIIAEQGWIFLGPFIAIGLWQLRGQALARPTILYAALMYGAMTLVFSFPGARGGLFHSGAALLPFYSAASFVGLDAAVDWVARRLPHWQPEKAKRNFSGLIIGAAMVLTLVLVLPKVTTWNASGELFRQIGAAIPGEAVVMSNNPPGFWIATGHPGIPLVNGDVPDLLAAASQYSARYVLLDQHLTPGLIELYFTESGERLKLMGRWGEWKLFEILP